MRPKAISVKPRIFEPRVIGCEGASTRNFPSCPVSTRRRYSTSWSRANSSTGIDPVNMMMSSGNLSGRKWLLKKCTVKRKTAARNASSPCAIIATLNTQPGRKLPVSDGNHIMKPLTPMIVTPQNGAQ